MATITEDYVSFEIAKLLKERGFQQLQNNCGYFTTEMIYSINVDDNGKHHFAHQYPAGVYNKDKYIAAPTLQMAMKWLREVHNLFIEIQCYGCGADKEAHFEYSYIISEYVKINNGICIIFGLEKRDAKSRFPSYEEAVEAAIKYCLENLI